MFVKLFGTILQSSIWSEDPATRLVWITLLTLANSDGYVRSSTSGLARTANVPLASTKRALTVLSSPDEESGTQEHEGRRIEAVEGGWFLLNYKKYREIRTKEQLANTERQRRFREKQSVTSNGDNDEVTDVTTTASASASSSGVVVGEGKGEKESKSLVPGDPVQVLITRLADVESASNGTQQREAAVNLGVDIVFQYWMAKMGHPRAVLDTKRRTKLASRLRENRCDVSELLYVIDGAKRDDWLMGRDPKSTKKYDGIETLFKGREQVERLAELAPDSEERPHKLLKGDDDGATAPAMPNV